MSDFHYYSGELVLRGDFVLIVDKRGVVDQVISKGTREAKDFGCFETGGLLLKFEDGDLQLWPWVNEDLKFIKRADEST